MTEEFRLRLREARLYSRTMRTRFPFVFGKVSISELSILYARLFLESQAGVIFEGVSASALSPQWFDKRPGRTAEDKQADLLYSVSQSIEAYAAAGLATAWDLHRATAGPLHERLVDTGMTGLAAGFGVALIDAAVADGACRFLNKPFSAALHQGLGLPPQDAALLPRQPLNSIRLRHTIGLADPLSDSDLDNGPPDGLPRTLEQVLHVYAPTFFKLKISADTAQTMARLHRIAEVLDTRAANYAVTLDGNEQFAEMAAFRSFLEQLRRQPALQNLFSRILWIEQPVMRESALNARAATDLARVASYKPVIIDESDDSDIALDRALALGYSGVSVKTCKGVFRSVSHYLQLRRVHAETHRRLILSSEDLTTLPVHPLQQDLCLAAALGLEHSERNGHHYVRAFEFMTEAERTDALSDYPSLYEGDADTGVRVRIADGALALEQVNSAAGFGSQSFPDWPALQMLE